MEHIQKDDIIIRKGILHILDSHTGYLGLSSQLLDMGPDLMEFVRGHIFKIMESDDAKRCQFDGSVSPILSLLESMDETDDESFIEATRILGENLFDIMCDSVTIPAGDLLCVAKTNSNVDEEYSEYWQKDMCLNWSNIKGCIACEKDCDSCTSFKRIPVQHCKRCGKDFFERKSADFCSDCRSARLYQARKKYAILQRKKEKIR